MNEYLNQAEEFCRKNNATIKIEFFKEVVNAWHIPYAASWKHNQYKIKITRKDDQNRKKQFTFIFTDSANNYIEGKTPTAYDVLACLTKYDVGTYEDFCKEFGYEMYNEQSKTTYKQVKKEYKNVLHMFGDCMEELQEIW